MNELEGVCCPIADHVKMPLRIIAILLYGKDTLRSVTGSLAFWILKWRPQSLRIIVSGLRARAYPDLQSKSFPIALCHCRFKSVKAFLK